MYKGFAKCELKSEFDTLFSKNMSMIDYFRHIFKSSMKALIVKGKKNVCKIDINESIAELWMQLLK